MVHLQPYVELVSAPVGFSGNRVGSIEFGKIFSMPKFINKVKASLQTSNFKLQSLLQFVALISTNSF
ncbi:hypothetical protein SLEP1_g11938 [Rubroshorea leprosula]|nr:hypothetical protein SLEP1_g11938 [Rubroshorea leprosula]